MGSFARSFDRHLSRQIHLLLEAQETGSSEDAYPAEYSLDLVDGCTTPELANLAGLMLLQAEKDGAECMTFDLDKGVLTYTINGKEYKMAPPPIPLLVDLARAFVRDRRVDANGEGQLRVLLKRGRTTLTVRPSTSSSLALTITGFRRASEHLRRVERPGQRLRE